jgi:O-antigen/teichoic acid export membrane protein
MVKYGIKLAAEHPVDIETIIFVKIFTFPLSGIKKLAGQTLWYGLPTIISRFLGYIMNFTLPFFFKQPDTTADLTQVYAAIPFLNVLLTYGLETAYFRFSQQDKNKASLYNTLTVSLVCSTIGFGILLFLFKGTLVQVFKMEQFPQYITWMILIVITDALSTLPFARLRQENRPKKYAFARLAGILLNVIIVFFFVGIVPMLAKNNPDGFFSRFVTPDGGIIYYLIGNFCGSLFTFLVLQRELRQVRWQFDKTLWREVMKYAAPLVIVGLGGMVNDMLSRLIYQFVVDLPEKQAKHELGIFGNIYRLAVLITIMIQAFRMAAEPFFFGRANQEDAPRTYARIMKFFVIACCIMFLFIALFVDVFKWFFGAIDRPNWIEGLDVVPLLALGNIFLGVYYNLSIWYKLTNRNMAGAWITLGGVLLTVVLNILLIPKYHYTGAAIATFACYLFMMVTSYKMGQKHYPVPYARKKLTAYIITVVVLYLIHVLITWIIPHILFSVATGLLLLWFFLWLISKTEAKELKKIPVVNRFVK